MIRKWYPHVVSTVALVVALTMGGAYAAGIGSKQIKNGSIRSVDLARGAVRSPDIAKGQVKAAAIGRDQVKAAAIGDDQVTAAAIAPNQVGTEQIAPDAVGTAEVAPSAISSTEIANGTVQSADIGAGEVTPQNVTMPPPTTLSLPAGQPAVARPTAEYAHVVTIGRYAKQDATSALEVNWTGSAKGGFRPCVFQLRVDGQPSTGAAGELYVANGTTLSVSATALFNGLPAGEHTVELWARIPQQADPLHECTVGPTETEIGQTVVVTEQIV